MVRVRPPAFSRRRDPRSTGRPAERLFIGGKTGADLPARDRLHQSPAAACDSFATVKDSLRCWAEVDLDALRENLAWIRHRAGPKVKIMTVVKADAYGHGLKQIAALLMQSGTDIFGVANLAEARSIHSVGRGWPVLMLGACLPGEIERTVLDGVRPTISSWSEARQFSRAALRLNRVVQPHIKVD